MNRKVKPPIALYSALADATRCRIIEILAARPIAVHRLADEFSISRPAISRHLRVLKQAGLVVEVKQGRENLYAFRPRKLAGALGWIETWSTASSPLPAAEPEARNKATPAPREKRKSAPAAARPPKTGAVTQMGFDF